MRIILSCGTNLGDRMRNMEAMLAYCKQILLPPYAQSPLMETEPVDTSGNHPWYFNCIIAGRYTQTMHHLLQQCQKIETTLGRNNKGSMEPRTADIDILLADSLIVNEPDLIIPHPHLLNRRFCIEGITAIAPEFEHPVTGLSFKSLHRSMPREVLAQKIIFIDR